MVGHVQLVTYRINAADIIEDVNEGWRRFAVENGAPQLATEIIGKSLWDYVSGRNVRRIYASVFKRVRTEQRTVSFPFRCDSPDLHRAMRLFVAPLSDKRLGFRSVLEMTVAHSRKLDILRPSTHGTSQFALKMCSWCKAIEIAEQWKPIEVALEELNLLCREGSPMITNDVCGSCLEEYLRKESLND